MQASSFESANKNDECPVRHRGLARQPCDPVTSANGSGPVLSPVGQCWTLFNPGTDCGRSAHSASCSTPRLHRISSSWQQAITLTRSGKAGVQSQPDPQRTMDKAMDSVEFALRLVLIVALAIHSALDVTDPCHGAKSYMLQIDYDQNQIPRWLLPAKGALMAVAAVALSWFSDNVFVCALALGYTSAMWSGAVFFHVRQRHHPAATLPAGFFVLLVFVIAALRFSVLLAIILGTAVCALLAWGLARVLVAEADTDNQPILQNKGVDG